MRNFKASPNSRCFVCKTAAPRGWMAWSAKGPVIVCSASCDATVKEGAEVHDALKKVHGSKP